MLISCSEQDLPHTTNKHTNDCVVQWREQWRCVLGNASKNKCPKRRIIKQIMIFDCTFIVCEEEEAVLGLIVRTF